MSGSGEEVAESGASSISVHLPRSEDSQRGARARNTIKGRLWPPGRTTRHTLTVVALTVLAYFGALGLIGQLVLRLVPGSFQTISLALVIVLVGLSTVVIMNELQPIHDDAMEVGGIRTIRVLVTGVGASLTMGATFVVLGAQVPEDFDGRLWNYDEAIAGLLAAIAAAGMAGVGFVFGSTEGRISEASNGFVQSHRKTLNLVRLLDHEMETLWQSFNDIACDVGRTFLSKLQMSSLIFDEEISGERRQGMLDDAFDQISEGSCFEAALDAALDAAKVCFSTESYLTETHWDSGHGKLLMTLRYGIVGFGPESESNLWGLFPVDEAFSVNQVFREGTSSFTPTVFQRTAIDLSREIAEEFLRRNEDSLARARAFSSSLADHTADVPIRTELLFDDLTLLNLLLRPFESERESTERLDVAAIRFLTYAASYSSARDAGHAIASREDLPEGSLQLGYLGYLQKITAPVGEAERDAPETLSQTHPLFGLGSFISSVLGYLQVLDVSETKEALMKVRTEIKETPNKLHLSQLIPHTRLILLGLLADFTYARSPLRNWTRTFRSVECRQELMNHETANDPIRLLALDAGDRSENTGDRSEFELKVLRVQQRRHPDNAWQILAEQYKLIQVGGAEPIRVISLSDLDSMKSGTRSSLLAQRLKLSGVIL